VAATGALQSLPWACLHDGNRWLVERYSICRASTQAHSWFQPPATPIRTFIGGTGKGIIGVASDIDVLPEMPRGFFADFRVFFNCWRPTANRKVVPEENSVKIDINLRKFLELKLKSILYHQIHPLYHARMRFESLATNLRLNFPTKHLYMAAAAVSMWTTSDLSIFPD